MNKEDFSVERIRSHVDSTKKAGRTHLITCLMVRCAIRAWLDGIISNEQLSEWADFIDANEDVELESDEVMPDVIFELASPEINGWPDQSRALELLDLLNRVGADPGGQ